MDCSLSDAVSSATCLRQLASATECVLSYHLPARRPLAVFQQTVLKHPVPVTDLLVDTPELCTAMPEGAFSPIRWSFRSQPVENLRKSSFALRSSIMHLTPDSADGEEAVE